MFRFKQFVVRQERSAMKVCTDSCLFGALIEAPNAKRALDIGTGTGLLSLMVAQRYPALNIDAVEIDAGAVQDATENVMGSPFSSRIKVYHQDIKDFVPKEKYEVIFCNPPFYENRLSSPDPKKNLAHHASLLKWKEVSECAKNLLTEDGKLWLLLPPFEMEQFRSQSPEWEIEKQYLIRHRRDKPIFREIACHSLNKPSSTLVEEWNIYENEKYSGIFAEVLRDYYLIF